MAKNFNYCRPAGFEFDDNSDDDDFDFSSVTNHPTDRYEFRNSCEEQSDTKEKLIEVPPTNGLRDVDDSNVDWKSSWGAGNSFWKSLTAPPVQRIQAETSSLVTALLLVDDFLTAAVKNNVTVLESFIKQGVDIESRLRSGWTAVMHAAYAAKSDAVRCLLRHEANPNAHKDEFTLLMAACCSNSKNKHDVLDCVNQLLEKGVDIHACNRNGITPLMFASRQGHTLVVKRLIELDARLNEQDNSGYTALMYAVERGNTDVVKTLLDAKVDVTIITPDGSTLTDLAFAFNQKQIRQILENYLESKENDESVDDEKENPVKTKETTEKPSWSKTTPISSYNYSDVDLFLCGLELNDFIETFRQHDISFAKFLRLRDRDLIEIGIIQLGVRKKILDALKEAHKKNWETSAVTPIDYNRKITCLDSVALVGNVHMHASFIASTIGYVSDQISTDTEIIQKAPENEAKDLCINAEEAIVNVRHLYEELDILNSRLDKICRYQDCRPPDLIRMDSNVDKKLKINRIFFIGVIGSILTVAWFRCHKLLSVHHDI